MVPFAVIGIAVWAVLGLVVLIFFPDGHENWLWTCLAGFLLGFPGLAVMIRHDANRRRRLVSRPRRRPDDLISTTWRAGRTDRPVAGCGDDRPASALASKRGLWILRKYRPT